MKSVSFYHKETGLLHAERLTVSDDEAVALNTPPDHIAIDGHHDPLSKRVDIATGEFVDYQPPAPSTGHEWNAETRRWQLTADAANRAHQRAVAIARIAQLEASQHRLVRQCCLDVAGSVEKLKAIDDEIFLLEAGL